MGPPRGMLRHITLQIMKDRPISGSELMDEIEKYTEWRPSPGSIYPLLSHLQEDGLIKKHRNDDAAHKRFILTEKGKEELEEHRRFDDQFRKRNKTIRKIYWRLHREMPEDIYNSFSNLFDQIEKTFQFSLQDPAKQGKLITVLEKTRKELEELANE
jgi:DNA-binding PadR family transcriptional regulator